MSLRLARMLVAGNLLLALPAALLAAPLTGRWERRPPATPFFPSGMASTRWPTPGCGQWLNPAGPNGTKK